MNSDVVKTAQLLALVPLLFLFACAPAAEPGRVSVTQLAEEVSFYPQETGATWQYLPDGERLDARRIIQRVEGPTMISGERYTLWRLVGQGLDVASYRQYRPDGVFLSREVRPGTQIIFNPPLQELPAPGSLREGATWGGETTASLYFPEADPENQRTQFPISYRYVVVDRRPVAVIAGQFEVFVINFESETRNDQGDVIDSVRQEIWYAPFVGEVRTENGFLLVETNFRETKSAQR